MTVASIAQPPGLTIPDGVMTDLVNSMDNLRATAQNYPRMDNILHATLGYAADAIAALLAVVDAQDVAVSHFTMVDAAQFKGVSYHTVSRAVRRGKLTHHRIGRQVMIARPDLDTWHPMIERRPARYRHYCPDETVSPSIVGEMRS